VDDDSSFEGKGKKPSEIIEAWTMKMEKIQSHHGSGQSDTFFLRP
jgi:hypothetical protein